MEKRILVPVADGTEMVEALSIVDVFRRAGQEVVMASVHDLVFTSSHGVRIQADRLIGDCLEDDFDLIAIPGGIPGAANLRDSRELKEILLRHSDAGRLYGAICAAPAVVLKSHGLLEGRRATCHPAFIAQLSSSDESRVVIDGNCVTSRGAGTSIDFALELLGLLAGEERKREVAKAMVVAVV